jgi:hypothetical protein
VAVLLTGVDREYLLEPGEGLETSLGVLRVPDDVEPGDGVRTHLDETFTVRTAEGERTQEWRYPSRTECMVCHTRAANFVLGPSLLQMNRDHDYGGVTDNQLRVLEHLDLLRVNWRAEVVAALREVRRLATDPAWYVDLREAALVTAELDEDQRSMLERDAVEPALEEARGRRDRLREALDGA